MFYKELIQKLGIEQAECAFFCVNFGNDALCVQGKIKILQFTATKIVLQCGKQKLFIYGNNLKLGTLEKTEINIKGQVICTSAKEVQIVS